MRKLQITTGKGKVLVFMMVIPTQTIKSYTGCFRFCLIVKFNNNTWYIIILIDREILIEHN